MKTLGFVCEECGKNMGTIDVSAHPANLLNMVILCKDCYEQLRYGI